MEIVGAVLSGLILIAIFFGGFGSWAALAPLDSAAIAPGMVVVHSQRKTVQHLEGGIVGEILVADGDAVRAGQPLIRLDGTQPRAVLDLLRRQRQSAAALEARLVAERDGLGVIVFPDWLLAGTSDPAIDAMLTGQRAIFHARRQAIEGQGGILRRRIAQFQEEIGGLDDQIEAESRQIALIHEEIAGVSELVAKGLERKPRLLALQRRSAEIEGSRARNQAAIARARQSIGEAELRILELRTTLLNEVVQELREVQAELQDLGERIPSAEDVLARTVIVAPVAGKVVDLRTVTRGGVIAPGEPILDIVPSGDELVIEARISPTDIDVVHAGLVAEVRLTAFNQRALPIILGHVIDVSADRLTDEASGETYYQARVLLQDDQESALERLSLYPGMPVEVLIVTGTRTTLDYLLRPIADSMARALSED